MAKQTLGLIVLTTILMTNAMFTCSVSAANTEVVDRIVAVVNEDVISLKDLNDQIRPFIEKISDMKYPPEQERLMIFKVREEMLAQLIDQKLTDQEIARYKITASDKEVDNAIERIKATNSYTEENLREALKREGFTIEEYRKRIKDHILRSTLVNREIKSKIVITREDIKAYYDKNPDAFGAAEKYHLEVIMIRVAENADSFTSKRILQQMEDIQQNIKAGKSADEVIRMFSDAPFKVLGGDLGSFDLSSLDPKIREAVKGMKPGQYSEIIETDQGYKIFKLLNMVKSTAKPLAEVSEQIENMLYKDIVDQKFTTWLKELKTRSYIKIIK